jgi:hypothetical protein
MSRNAEDNLFARHGKLHFLKLQFVPIESALDSLLRSMRNFRRHLDSVGPTLPESHDQLNDLMGLDDVMAARENQMESYKQHVRALVEKCDSTTYLLQEVANSRSQNIGREQNGYMMRLTKAALEDSAAIRVITVITMIYLSPTVVGVSILATHQSNGANSLV